MKTDGCERCLRFKNLTLIMEMDMRMILLALVAEAFLEEALSKDKAP